MNTKFAAILLATTAMTGAAFADNHGSEAKTEGDASMQEKSDTSSEAMNMEKHDAAVAAIAAGDDEVLTSDDVVIGLAQRVQVDSKGNIVGLIRLSDELDTDMTAIKTPLLVVTEDGATVLRVGVTEADMQAALDQRKE